MLRDDLGQTYKKVVLSQAGLMFLSVGVALIVGGQTAAISALCGGAVVVSGSIIYAVLATESKVSAVSAGRVLGRHLLAEAAKVLVVVALMFAALASGWFAAAWLLAAMGVTLLGHWLALLIIR